MKEKIGYLAGGVFTGSANGLFGGGGGMIAVPFLERVVKYSPLRAHATAIAVILPATIVSAIVYLIFGLVPLSVLLPVALGVSAGGLAGARLLPVLPEKAVTIAFSVLMLIAGLRMLF